MKITKVTMDAIKIEPESQQEQIELMFSLGITKPNLTEVLCELKGYGFKE